MKPKEFDELVRQKFDRNDFAYNPANWDKLAEKLEGGEKKRSIIMWWWVPLAGMAASVALAMGISTLLHQDMSGNAAGNIARVQQGQNAQPHAVQQGALTYQPAQTAQNETSGNDEQYTASVNNTPGSISHNKHTTKKRSANKTIAVNDEDNFGIDLKNAVGSNKVVWQARKIDLTKENTPAAKKDKQLATLDAIETFKPEEEKVVKAPKISIILSGGVNRGNQNSGYMAGGTIRRMINDKVYIESDVAFASSTNTQSTEYITQQIPISAGAAKHMSGGKITSAEASKGSHPTVMEDVIGNKDISYDLYYAQVTPSIGYKVIKRMSVGLGPDFQQMLGDNRPAPSTVDRNNIQVAPTFDIGFVGKTEYALTKKIRTGVYYRKGVNNIITPMDKYIDRDYLQFQVKYTIFNK